MPKPAHPSELANTTRDPEIRDPETCDPEARDPETRRIGKVSESKKLSFPSRNRRMAAAGKRTHMEEHIRGHSKEKTTANHYVRGDDGYGLRPSYDFQQSFSSLLAVSSAYISVFVYMLLRLRVHTHIDAEMFL